MPRTARSATTTTDHDEIREWVEERGGSPAAVKRATRGDAGILRIDFPGFTGKNLKHISWDEWFRTFDKAGLAFLHRDQDRFNKIVRRGSNARRGDGEERGAKSEAKRGTASRTRSARTTGAGARKTKSRSTRSSSSSSARKGSQRRARTKR